MEGEFRVTVEESDGALRLREQWRANTLMYALPSKLGRWDLSAQEVVSGPKLDKNIYAVSNRESYFQV